MRTTTDSFAGSVEPHNVSLAGNSWGESTLNWTNRPAITGAPIGTIAGGTSPNSVRHHAARTPAALQTPGEVTLAVTNSGTDNLWFWSRNHTNASYRPVLTLTYSEADIAPPLKPAGLAATVDGYTADLTLGRAARQRRRHGLRPAPLERLRVRPEPVDARRVAAPRRPTRTAP